MHNIFRCGWIYTLFGELGCIYKGDGQAKKRHDNGNLLLKNKKAKENPAHFQAHLAAPTHERPLRRQKSLHFSDPLGRDNLLKTFEII